jgi:hypothetical protein
MDSKSRFSRRRRFGGLAEAPQRKNLEKGRF